MINDLVQSWGARIKFVDDLTVLEVVPRNSPSLLNVVVDDIDAFAVNNNMRLNPGKCKSMTVDFLHYNSCVASTLAARGPTDGFMHWHNSTSAKFPLANIVHIYCALIGSILEYASAVFADLPKYLACYLENMRTRALSITWPGISYEAALDKAVLPTLSARRTVSAR